MRFTVGEVRRRKERFSLHRNMFSTLACTLPRKHWYKTDQCLYTLLDEGIFRSLEIFYMVEPIPSESFAAVPPSLRRDIPSPFEPVISPNRCAGDHVNRYAPKSWICGENPHTHSFMSGGPIPKMLEGGIRRLHISKEEMINTESAERHLMLKEGHSLKMENGAFVPGGKDDYAHLNYKTLCDKPKRVILGVNLVGSGCEWSEHRFAYVLRTATESEPVYHRIVGIACDKAKIPAWVLTGTVAARQAKLRVKTEEFGLYAGISQDPLRVEQFASLNAMKAVAMYNMGAIFPHAKQNTRFFRSADPMDGEAESEEGVVNVYSPDGVVDYLEAYYHFSVEDQKDCLALDLSMFLTSALRYQSCGRPREGVKVSREDLAEYVKLGLLSQAVYDRHLSQQNSVADIESISAAHVIVASMTCGMAFWNTLSALHCEPNVDVFTQLPGLVRPIPRQECGGSYVRRLHGYMGSKPVGWAAEGLRRVMAEGMIHHYPVRNKGDIANLLAAGCTQRLRWLTYHPRRDCLMQYNPHVWHASYNDPTTVLVGHHVNYLRTFYGALEVHKPVLDYADWLNGFPCAPVWDPTWHKACLQFKASPSQVRSATVERFVLQSLSGTYVNIDLGEKTSNVICGPQIQSVERRIALCAGILYEARLMFQIGDPVTYAWVVDQVMKEVMLQNLECLPGALWEQIQEEGWDEWLQLTEVPE